MNRHLHLDPVGGISGDMFLGAMLSAFPDARTPLVQDWQDAGIADHVRLELEETREKGFACLRAKVITASDAPPTAHWADIRARIAESALRTPVQERAIAIFSKLAEAEAACHGVTVDQVHFHEIADWDSLADIIGAASVLESSGASSFSTSPIPIGGGRTRTQHGLIPVPAPATAELLHGFELFDDGGRGERVTPTGAAILAHLIPTPLPYSPRGLLASRGTGAGQMQIAGIPNILRILTLDTLSAPAQAVSLIRFEIDDMTPEELSVALDHLRAADGVLDAGYQIGFGKKGRTQFSVTVMTQPAQCDHVITRCFEETSTIGLRVDMTHRHVLPRTETVRNGTPIKTVARPGGTTSKAESDALARTSTLKARRWQAKQAEQCDDD
ncbi:hypothetical protein SAMN04488030_0130 [Aliiroseovarius halocynthiae]|uniref:DUF111 family protein n=1 Tax=Aliiroseovarius halocynthiae TaxID=985055 RepID=A0A545SL66_9RHOB|nr:LarC family nickel insertion protein [Aliiroseovarius halocynthiae]TQV65725.1 DUF111 family protein [Aliiroseovarius halocynthiae]SMR83980.1 hypothetical protein SAMN04488030_0130 [Aliiroseovarius halocynthiae]